MRPELTGIDGGLMRRHRREQKVLDRCRRLGMYVEKMDVPEGSRNQYLVFPLDNPEFKMQFGIGSLERWVKWEEEHAVLSRRDGS